jgi:hypothetical protein
VVKAPESTNEVLDSGVDMVRVGAEPAGRETKEETSGLEALAIVSEIDSMVLVVERAGVEEAEVLRTVESEIERSDVDGIMLTLDTKVPEM